MTLEERVERLEAWMAEATKPRLRVGDTLYGFCGGYFGRDDYDTKVVTEIGPKYVTARPIDGGAPRTAHVVDPEELLEYTKRQCYYCEGDHDDGDCGAP